MRRILSFTLVLVLLLTFSAVFAEQSPQNVPPPPRIQEIIEEYQTVYRLTVHYIYLGGGTAAPTHTEQLNAGSSYYVASPGIPGYTVSTKAVSGVLPARDMEYTVVYMPISSSGSGSGSGSGSDADEQPTFLTIEDYETPLGLGTSFMQEGICIE